MQLASSMTAYARDLLDREWEVVGRAAANRLAVGRMQLMAGLQAARQQMLHVLEELVPLVECEPDVPAEAHRAAVGQTLRQLRFVADFDEAGDGQVSELLLDDQVEVLLRVLEQVRRRALRQGLWSALPPAPLMCG